MSLSDCKEMPRRIAVVMVDDMSEGLALRQAIEVVGGFEVPVDLVAVGRCAHLIAALCGEASDADHIILSCHGDDEGIILPELHQAIAAKEAYTGRFGAGAIEKEARLAGRVVLSTGCSTSVLAEAFLAAGASAYIAPTDYPEGPAPFAFAVTFYYHLLSLSENLRTAFEAARTVGGDAQMFALFGSD